MSLSLSPVAVAHLDHLQDELVHLAEQKLTGAVDDEQYKAAIDKLLPVPDGDESAWSVPTPPAPVHLEVIKVLNGWRNMELVSKEKCSDLSQGTSSGVLAKAC